LARAALVLLLCLLWTTPARADPLPGYHGYAAMSAQIAAVAAANPDIVREFSIGRSAEGRQLWAVKISDNVAIDELEPEVLFVAGQHAREHITIEQALYLLDQLTSGDPRVVDLISKTEVYIVFNLNPDGSEYDTRGEFPRFWRKNRQKPFGVDLNRNWGYHWGGHGNVSRDPRSDGYRGKKPFSAPETRALRAFVRSRVIGGAQQIKAAIDIHSAAELVLWPYGYTTKNTAAGMTAKQYARLAHLGRIMAHANGYKAEQASDLYVAPGELPDWLWGEYHIYAYTFELGPGDEFYPAEFAGEVAKNREPVLLLLDAATRLP
jgi:predicted deacylase